MGKFFDLLGSGSVARQNKKKTAVMLIVVTLVLILVMLATLLIAQIVSSVKDKNAAENSGGGSGSGSGDGSLAGYVAEEIDSSKLHTGNLLLVNTSNEYIFDENPAVVSFSGHNGLYGLKNGSLKVNPTALAAFNELMTATKENVADSNVVVMTAYRSPEEQTDLANGTPAGYSDFHTGLSFELKDGDAYRTINDPELQGKYNWLYENAHKYGFIVRYPDNIPESADSKNAGKDFFSITGVDDYAWVLRYVGVAHATYIYDNELCLEEYLDLIRASHAPGSSLSIKGGDGKSYEVYYIEAADGDSTELQVPSKYSYEISGNNSDGFIITVNKSKTNKTN